eukprot:jgi/Mesen1/5117/ME000255S04092
MSGCAAASPPPATPPPPATLLPQAPIKGVGTPPPSPALVHSLPPPKATASPLAALMEEQYGDFVKLLNRTASYSSSAIFRQLAEALLANSGDLGTGATGDGVTVLAYTDGAADNLPPDVASLLQGPDGDEVAAKLFAGQLLPKYLTYADIKSKPTAVETVLGNTIMSVVRDGSVYFDAAFFVSPPPPRELSDGVPPPKKEASHSPPPSSKTRSSLLPPPALPSNSPPPTARGASSPPPVAFSSIFPSPSNQRRLLQTSNLVRTIQPDLFLNGIVSIQGVDGLLIPPLSFLLPSPRPPPPPPPLTELQKIILGLQASGRAQLRAVLRNTGLDVVLSQQPGATLLAPTDLAFAGIPDGVKALLAGPDGRAYLANLLRYHIIPQYKDLPALLARPGLYSLPSFLEKAPVLVYTAEGKVFFSSSDSGSNAAGGSRRRLLSGSTGIDVPLPSASFDVAPDILADGIISIQGIEAVLIPPLQLLMNLTLAPPLPPLSPPPPPPPPPPLPQAPATPRSPSPLPRLAPPPSKLPGNLLPQLSGRFSLV